MVPQAAKAVQLLKPTPSRVETLAGEQLKQMLEGGKILEATMPEIQQPHRTANLAGASKVKTAVGWGAQAGTTVRTTTVVAPRSCAVRRDYEYRSASVIAAAGEVVVE